VSLRSPLATVLGSGSAREGTGHFWQQRLSAAALVLLGLWFVFSLPAIAGAAQADLLRWIATPWNGIPLLLLVLTLGWHSSLGVQVVIEDYVHGPFIKLLSLILCKFVHVVAVAAAAYAILDVGFGAAA
jgi:succinate dehydrogenase / fumarate reductase membrane anchor subunit